MDVDTESIQDRIDYLEAEKHYLNQRIKELENAVEKQKKFHRKFVEDVVESEEIRIQDFDKERKELVEDRKRLVTENRQLAKDKLFYHHAYSQLIKDEEIKKSLNEPSIANQSTSETRDEALNSSNEPSKKSSQSTPAPKHSYETRRSCSILEASSSNAVSLPSTYQHKSLTKNSKIISKVSEKLFEDNKILKLKATKLIKDNASLRLKLKQLENFKTKILNKKLQQEKDHNEMQNLYEATSRTNRQIFTPDLLCELRKLSN